MEGRIKVLVDFDHTPTFEDEGMLEEMINFEVNWRFHLIPIIAGWVEIDRLDELPNLPGVTFVSLDGKLRLALEESIPVVGVDKVWDEYGYDGTGTVVAIIDTGVDNDHLGLDDLDDNNLTNDPKVIAFYDSVDNPTETDGSTEPYDNHGHGSHCAGIATGTGAPYFQNIGVAPQAKLVGVRAFEGLDTYYEDAIRAIEWVADNAAKYGINVASMRFGWASFVEFTQVQQVSVARAANALVDVGVIVVVAAGNEAEYGTIRSPGSALKVITVGAADKNRNLAGFSSKGPIHDGGIHFDVIKPDVVSVGVSVESVRANSLTEYVSFSGTSMATPMTAGIAALMVQANPSLQPVDVKNILGSTAEYHWELPQDEFLPKNNDWGWGFTEGYAAVTVAGAIHPDIRISINPPAQVEAGNTMLVSVINGTVDHLEWKGQQSGNQWEKINGTDTGNAAIQIPVINETGNWSFFLRGAIGSQSTPLEHVDVEVVAASADPEPQQKKKSETNLAIPLIIGGVGAGSLLAILAIVLLVKKI